MTRASAQVEGAADADVLYRVSLIAAAWSSAGSAPPPWNTGEGIAGLGWVSSGSGSGGGGGGGEVGRRWNVHRSGFRR